MKDLCQKWKVKLILRGAYWLSGTGIVECLEIIDVGCNLKQFDGLTSPTLTPIFLRQIYVTNYPRQLRVLLGPKHGCCQRIGYTFRLLCLFETSQF